MCLLVNKFSFDHFVSHIKQNRTEKLNFVVCQSISDQRYYRTWDIVQTNRKPKLLLNNHYCVQTYIYYSRAPILVKVKSLFYWKDFLKESLANPFHRSNWLKTIRKTSPWLKKKGENAGSCVRVVLVLCSNNLIVNINEVSNNVSLNIIYHMCLAYVVRLENVLIVSVYMAFMRIFQICIFQTFLILFSRLTLFCKYLLIAIDFVMN